MIKYRIQLENLAVPRETHQLKKTTMVTFRQLEIRTQTIKLKSKVVVRYAISHEASLTSIETMTRSQSVAKCSVPNVIRKKISSPATICLLLLKKE